MPVIAINPNLAAVPSDKRDENWAVEDLGKHWQHLTAETGLWPNMQRRKTTLLNTYSLADKATVYAASYFGAWLRAYNDHGSIAVTPEDLLLLADLLVSRAVEADPEGYRDAFVDFAGKEELKVTAIAAATNWMPFFGEIINVMQGRLNDKGRIIVGNMMPSFSKTSLLHRVLATSAILDTTKHFFDLAYVTTMCGIRNVHFGGDIADYRMLRDKVTAMEAWAKGPLIGQLQRFGAIVDKFIETMEGNIDAAWWDRIMNYERGSGGSGSDPFYISGWITGLLGLTGRVPAKQLSTKMLCVPVTLTDEHYYPPRVSKVEIVGGFYGMMIKEGEGGDFLVTPVSSVGVIEVEVVDAGGSAISSA